MRPILPPALYDGRCDRDGDRQQQTSASLKDMNRSDQLEALLDAGVSSLKIEGRLKDAGYVKNITAYYRKKLDAVLSRRPEYRRASAGRSTYTFEPVAEKSFNRGFTTFLLEGRTRILPLSTHLSRWANLSGWSKRSKAILLLWPA